MDKLRLNYKMESAGLVRGGEHPNLISSHHWSQKEVLKRSPENFQQTRRKTIAEDVLPLGIFCINFLIIFI